MSHVVFFVYKFILMPLLYGVLQIFRPLLKGKVRTLIDDKNSRFFVLNPSFDKNKPVIWIHAASGEIEYARPLIRELKLQWPQFNILVTYSSPSAKRILKNLEIDAWTALPWDFSGSFDVFFQQWKPKLLLVARTDLWPVMAESCSRHRISSRLFSATFAKNSSRLKGLTRYLTQKSLNYLSQIDCVSADDKINLSSLNLSVTINVSGDTRYDQVLYRLEQKQDIKWALKPQNKPTIVLGSTWPEDEAVLIPALPELINAGFEFILAPHEIHSDHLQKLRLLLDAHHIAYTFYSQTEEYKPGHVLIIDKVGILAELYSWSQIAFVGGSFKKQVHSVMEPLAAGNFVLVGPYHLNNREAILFQNILIHQQAAVTCISSSQEFIQSVVGLKPSLHHSPEITSYIKKQSGVTKGLIEKLRSLLESWA